jgi:DNA-binding transcriptional MerR regulator/methylmalonyl-CoA mutase cobalamin-binding subunit
MAAPKPHDAFPVKTAARLTGLSPDVIRVWERRYGAVEPIRQRRGGARLYSRADVARLKHLKHLVDSGRRIGDIANLDDRALATLAGTPHAAGPTPPLAERTTALSHGTRLVDAVERFDAEALTANLGDALAGLGARRFVRQIAAPLLVEIGERWADGRSSVADERLVSGVLRNLLGSLVTARGRRQGRRVVLATPHGERHDLGLMMVAILALDAGLSVYYLGADVPAEEIASAAKRARADVLGLGVVYGGNRARAIAELRAIQRALPSSTELWVGGADAFEVVKALRSKGPIAIADLDAVDGELRRVGRLG